MNQYVCDRCKKEINTGRTKMRLYDNAGEYGEYVDIDLCKECRKDFERFLKNEPNRPFRFGFGNLK